MAFNKQLMDSLGTKNQTIKNEYDIIYSVASNTAAPFYVRKKQDIFEQDYSYTEEYTMTPNHQQPPQPVAAQPKMFSIAEVRELVAKAWEDGYTTSSGDSFHNKNTSYAKSDFFKDFYAKYNKD